MTTMVTDTIVNQREQSVKSLTPQCNSSTTASMIHHKVLVHKNKNTGEVRLVRIGVPYGVSPSYRLLSPQLILKKFDYIRDCLKYIVGLSTSQREVMLRLLRFWAYYGAVFPKEAVITSEPGCSKATYWRTLRILQDAGLVTVINRYLIRPHAQVSNLYDLRNLARMIAKYLSEHIGYVWPDWFDATLHLSWPEFWNALEREGVADG